MQTFKKIVALAAFAMIAVESTLAQSSVSSVTSPEMPSVSAPTLGSGFYVPGNPKNSPFTGWPRRGAKNRGDASQKARPSAGIKKGAKDLLGDELGISEQEQIARDLAQSAAYLTGNERDDLLKALQNYQNASEKLRKENGGVSENAKKARILRFTIGGKDILQSCRSVYVSDVLQDGTFVVTGDRSCQGSGENLDEIFYIRFTATPQKADLKNYSACTYVTQSAESEESGLYRMSKLNALEANRTGHLVTLKTSAQEEDIDLLIDLGVEK
ncbi:MAG: hypothetical protein J6X11_11830 [Treponema sp.]|nr:hypothetical protein [Treponema sp.]MBQ1593262.1 hypothetical protein [Treponema sp.]MBR4386115.1 hypothetical protein [Treponema sp.]